MKLSYRWRRRLVSWRRILQELTASNRGDWIWLKTKPLPVASLNRDLWRWAEPSVNYYMLMFLSGVIATLGLLANSSATIIGAMIVAPLMGPIIAMAFAVAMGNRRLLKRASFSMVTGVLLNVATAALITFVLGIDTLTAEVQVRMQPTLIDLGVALAAGAAGAYAKARKHISDALPGVAIAVALVPPLSVIGIGIASWSRTVTVGSTLLFLTNLASVIFCGALVFLAQNYGSLGRAQRGLTVSVLVIALLGLPLGFSFRDLVIKERTRSRLNLLVRERTLALRNVNIETLTVRRRQASGLLVDLEISAPSDSISAQDIDVLHGFLEDELNTPVDLNVSVIPIDRFRALTQQDSSNRQIP
ncbi:DUF389 domain-containing protein [Almyronema epifaneia]|uniref:DUF389 domain-containing protein n=1 Tax=Almyronema epifaneia S1 TaxID=2991925 RepID=A0ABW6IBG6_9CYAN